MTRTKLAHVLALTAAFALAPCPAPRAAAPDAAEGFRRVQRLRADAAPEDAAFEFEAGGFSYHVAANGNGRRTKRDKTRRFNLRLDGRDFVEGVRFAVYEGDLLLVCDVNDGETGAGLVTRLEQPSMRALWRGLIPAADVGEPLREGHDLYVTGSGFVARLDLRTGEYVWQHDSTGDAAGDAHAGAATPFAGASPPFASFETPQLAGDTVLFRERPVYNQRRTAVFDKKTGKLIRIERGT